jgi:hypothetical protein
MNLFMKRFFSSEKKMVSPREFEKLERERKLHARGTTV